MSKDEQYYIDLLTSFPHSVHDYSLSIADIIDRQVDSIAANIRASLASSPWIPESARPTLPPPKIILPTPRLRQTVFEKTSRWILDHKLITAVFIASLTGGSYLVYRQRKAYSRKRRARRAPNGARKEVVVLAGAPHEPISRSLSLDLERRGFIVYVIVNTPEEDHLVRSESRADIRPLHLNITDPQSSRASIAQLSSILHHPQTPFPGSQPHSLTLSALILIPDTHYAIGPTETISPADWSDALNVKILSLIVTTQLLLPTIIDFKARILLLTPSIIASLAPPFHTVESSIVAALQGFSDGLRREVASLGVDVVHMRLGTFETGSVGGRHHLQAVNATRADVLGWDEGVRERYGRNYRKLEGRNGVVGGMKGSSLRELHNAVFDTVAARVRRPVWHVGAGSKTYDLAGRWIPRGVVGWILGLRRSRPEAKSTGKGTEGPVGWGTSGGIV